MSTRPTAGRVFTQVKLWLDSLFQTHVGQLSFDALVEELSPFLCSVILGRLQPKCNNHRVVVCDSVVSTYNAKRAVAFVLLRQLQVRIHSLRLHDLRLGLPARALCNTTVVDAKCDNVPHHTHTATPCAPPCARGGPGGVRVLPAVSLPCRTRLVSRVRTGR